MNLIILASILFSHALAVRPFVANLHKGKMPNTAHFAVVSIILYYDLGLVLKALEFSVEDPYFISFFEAKPWILVPAIIILILAPWLFLIGSKIANDKDGQDLTNTYSHLKESTKPLFYILVISVSIYFAVIGANEVLHDETLWAVRARVTEKWGPYIIFLYMPLHFLAFYTKQSDANSKTGLLLSIGLALATILSTLGIGQRTNMLLPVLILVLFRKKISFQKIGIFLAVATIAASALLPFFKWQKADDQDVSSSIGTLVAETIQTDFYRGNILVTSLEKSEVMGTKIMPYPMSGYLYTLLYYVPRNMAPFKGWSTSQTFTSIIDRTPVEETFWAFGVGAIEELLLSIGVVLCAPFLLIYGMGMGLLDKLSWRVPSLLIPTRLAAIWLCGYESSTVMLTFGTMAIVNIILHNLFVGRHSGQKFMPERTSFKRFV
jgi:general stress protein CsbA